MKKKPNVKLVLSRETVRQLTGIELGQVVGGTTSTEEGSSDRPACTGSGSSQCNLSHTC